MLLLPLHVNVIADINNGKEVFFIGSKPIKNDIWKYIFELEDCNLQGVCTGDELLSLYLSSRGKKNAFPLTFHSSFYSGLVCVVGGLKW